MTGIHLVDSLRMPSQPTHFYMCYLCVMLAYVTLAVCPLTMPVDVPPLLSLWFSRKLYCNGSVLGALLSPYLVGI
jgi:hypothetical protein